MLAAELKRAQRQRLLHLPAQKAELANDFWRVLPRARRWITVATRDQLHLFLESGDATMILFYPPRRRATIA